MEASGPRIHQQATYTCGSSTIPVARSSAACLVLLREPWSLLSGVPDWPGLKGIVFGMLFTEQSNYVQAAASAFPCVFGVHV